MDALSPVSLPLDLMRSPNLDDNVKQTKALKELEGVFLGLLLKEMRKTVPEDGILATSSAQKMFREMLDEVYAQKMAESGQFGIAKIMAEQIELQGKQAEIRAALSKEAGEKSIPLAPAVRAPEFMSLPQLHPNQDFMPLKLRPKTADMFSIDNSD